MQLEPGDIYDKLEFDKIIDLFRHDVSYSLSVL